MFQSKKPKKLSRGVRHERKFCLRTDASRPATLLNALSIMGGVLARNNDIFLLKW